MNNVTTVILGGGRGSRLYPLTQQRAKPAVSFAGKYRLIDVPISNCINSHLRRVFVLTQFLSVSLHRHIKKTFQFDSFTDGFVEILAAEQTNKSRDWFQGTADAVRATLKHTTYFNTDDVLILSGDHLYRMDYSKLIKFHREREADVTLCVTPVDRQEAPRMGLIKVDTCGQVEDFVEKPDDPAVLDDFIAPEEICRGSGASASVRAGAERFLGSMGVYIFKTSVLEQLLQDGTLNDFGKEVIPSALDTYRLFAYPFEGYWRDIGTIDAFFEANIALAQEFPAFSLYEPMWPFYTHTRSLPPNRFFHSEIRDSLVAEGTDINGASITDSIVGVRSVIRQNTTLKDVVFMGADYYDGEQESYMGKPPAKGSPQLGIGRSCHLERAIIDKNARIGERVVIRPKHDAEDFSSEMYWIRDGITIIPRGAVIPPGTVI